jgi:hypothetical protein
VIKQVNGLYLGKTPARHGAVTFKMSQFVDLDSVVLPKYFGHEREKIDYGVLDNDECGDCVIADIAHRIMIDARGCGRPVPTFNKTVVPIYTALTGYDPKVPLDADGNNPTDNGTDMAAAAEYWRTNGIKDDVGVIHKAKAYGEIQVGNWDQLLKATYLYGGASLGVQLPQSAMDQFDQQVPWTILTGSPDIVGGHAITSCGLNTEGHLVIITWGRTQAVTRPWLERFMDEGVCTFSREYLLSTNRTPELFDEVSLDAALVALTKSRASPHHL